MEVLKRLNTPLYIFMFSKLNFNYIHCAILKQRSLYFKQFLLQIMVMKEKHIRQLPVQNGEKKMSLSGPVISTFIWLEKNCNMFVFTIILSDRADLYKEIHTGVIQVSVKIQQHEESTAGIWDYLTLNIFSNRSKCTLESLSKKILNGKVKLMLFDFYNRIPESASKENKDHTGVLCSFIFFFSTCCPLNAFPPFSSHLEHLILWKST